MKKPLPTNCPICEMELITLSLPNLGMGASIYCPTIVIDVFMKLRSSHYTYYDHYYRASEKICFEFGEIQIYSADEGGSNTNYSSIFYADPICNKQEIINFALDSKDAIEFAKNFSKDSSILK